MGASKFHISLNVHDLRRTATFLELLLGTGPTQLHSNYAKFELVDPPLVLSLVPTEVPTNTGINHLGFRLPNRESLDAMRDRLQRAGIAHEIEDSAACCHSRQSKFWVHDPAGNLWEFYVLDEAGACDAQSIDVPKIASAMPKHESDSVWAHRLGDSFPSHIPTENGTLDKVVLEGTLNARLFNGQAAAILDEASRALRAGGLLTVHGLTADRPLTGPPSLPGPAAKVQHVPTHREVLDAVELAGFTGLELVTFGESYSFSHAGAELREIKLHALKRDSSLGQNDRVAIYRGPFSEVRDESGQIFRRGEPVLVNDETYNRLCNSTAAAQFEFESPGDQKLVQIRVAASKTPTT